MKRNLVKPLAQLLAVVPATFLLAATFQQPALGQAARPAQFLVSAEPQAKKGGDSRSPWRQASPVFFKGSALSIAQLYDFVNEYLRLHAAKDMTNWEKLFAFDAKIVRTGDDGKIITYTPAELAKGITDEAKKLESQHEAFDDIIVDTEGDAASFIGSWRLFHNGQEVRQGRAWFTLVRRAGKWQITSLVWFRRAGTGVR